MEIRAATPSDAPAVLALWSRALDDASTPDDVAAVERLLDRDPGGLLVARRGGALVGTLIAGWDGWRGALPPRRGARGVPPRRRERR